MTYQDIDSKVSTTLRLPLALMVIFIHSLGAPSSYTIVDIDWSQCNGIDVFNLFRTLISRVFCQIAVPTFYILSGYYFFFSVESKIRLSGFWNVFVQKFRRRFFTLFIPYIIWNLVYVVWTLKFSIIDICFQRNYFQLFSIFNDNGGLLKMLWCSSSWTRGYADILGAIGSNTAPVLIPLWFIRDLMVTILLTPVIFVLIRRSGILFLGSLAVLFLSGMSTGIPGLSLASVFFFTIGGFWAIKKDSFSEILLLRRVKIPIYTIALLALLILTFNFGNRSFVMGTLFQIFRICGSLSILALFVSFIVKGCKFKILEKYSDSSFFIYTTHAIWGIEIVSFLIYSFFAINPLDRPAPGDTMTLSCGETVLAIFRYVAVPVITLIFCILLYKIFNLYMPSGFWRLLNGGRSKKN